MHFGLAPLLLGPNLAPAPSAATAGHAQAHPPSRFFRLFPLPISHCFRRDHPCPRAFTEASSTCGSVPLAVSPSTATTVRRNSGEEDSRKCALDALRPHYSLLGPQGTAACLARCAFLPTRPLYRANLGITATPRHPCPTPLRSPAPLDTVPLCGFHVKSRAALHDGLVPNYPHSSLRLHSQRMGP